MIVLLRTIFFMDNVVFLYLSLSLLTLTLTKASFFLIFAHKQHNKFKKYFFNQKIPTDAPFVSVIVPAFNEEAVLENCINSLLKQEYCKFEIIIVDDGSKDNTAKIGTQLQRTHTQVKFISKENGGKADALNTGISYSKGDIIVCMDADSMFLPDTIKNLVLSFNDPTVGAVAGNVRIANRRTILGKNQAAEYMSGLTLQRQAFGFLGCIQVISGALATFRRNTIREVGGYSKDTLVEDMDITIACAKNKYSIIYNPYAIAYTEGPSTWSDLIKQRHRWIFGGFQVIKKYKHMLWKKEYGSMAFVGLPYFVIFPWMDVLSSILFITTLTVSILTSSLHIFVLYILGMLFLQAMMIWYATYLDKEDTNLVWYALISTFFYSHLLNYVTVIAGISYTIKRNVRWDKLKRIGANVIDIPNVVKNKSLKEDPAN